ncbi:hypothetical protein [Cupriavidus sp. H18C1]|uniref:hypothetical protein n=1 Tax=Cupriavidus sp. H18C1 TaxID=3241601 RepID=UPI003BB90CB8
MATPGWQAPLSGTAGPMPGRKCAIAAGISVANTSRTPGIALTSAALNDTTLALITGGWTTIAVSMPGSLISTAYCARPVSLSATR